MHFSTVIPLIFLGQFVSFGKGEHLVLLDPLYPCCRKLGNNLQEIGDKIATLSESFLPVGFVYAQFGDQKDPNELWSMFQWQDISANFMSQFFRAEGSDSAAFGMGQLASCPKITAMQGFQAPANTFASAITITDGVSSPIYLGTGGTSPNNDGFQVVGEGEGNNIYPRNSAVRIWKRI